VLLLRTFQNIICHSIPNQSKAHNKKKGKGTATLEFSNLTIDIKAFKEQLTMAAQKEEEGKINKKLSVFLYFFLFKGMKLLLQHKVKITF